MELDEQAVRFTDLRAQMGSFESHGMRVGLGDGFGFET
jgi:hypothetical protein